MEIYEVYYTPITEDGWEKPMRIAKRFSSMEKAKEYVEKQESLWQKHTDEGKAISPCWYDRKKEMKIVPVKVY